MERRIPHRYLDNISITTILLFVLCYILFNVIPCCCSQAPSMLCSHVEREALLKFKHSLNDPSNRLRSWAGDDCCNWAGIRCDNRTGRVIRLDVRNPHPFNWTLYDENNGHDDPVYAKSCLVGSEVNPSLLDLKHLKHLDLGRNNFSGIPIPNFFGSFPELRYLNLSSSFFGGVVPHHLGNLSNLHSLDLNSFGYGGLPYDVPQVRVNNLQWVSGLSHLEHLDMSYVNLSQAFNPLQAIGSIPHLLELHLDGCGISQNLQLFISNPNLTSLVVLNLAQNDFHGPLPNFIQNMTSLQVLELHGNGFNGTIHHDLSHLCNLETLDLGSNELSGEIHKLFENSSSSKCFKNSKLKELYLDSNQLSGHVPDWLGQLKNLRLLYLYRNSFVGPLPPSLWKLSSLRSLHLSSNSFVGPLPPSLGKLSSLRSLYLADNKFNGSIGSNSESLFGQLLHLEVLDLSSNSFVGPIPPSLGKLSSLRSLSLADNKFNGSIGSNSESLFEQLLHLEELDLSSNSFVGPIHPSSLGKLSSLRSLYLGGNKFNGSIGSNSESLFGQLLHLEVLDLSSNSFVGPIPPSLWKLSSLRYLDLSSNSFVGPIHPSSLGKLSSLTSLDLSSNSFEGVLSDIHFANLSNLKQLQLGSNSLILNTRSDWIPPFQLDFIGLGSCKMGPKFPMWLKTQKTLSYLNVSNANINDTVPTWLFDLFSNTSESRLSIDLSNNQLYGSVPKIFIPKDFDDFILYLHHNKFDGPLPRLPSSATVIDLSHNLFSGPIHHIGAAFPNLQVLVLSNNSFTGTIPHSLCEMNSLGILDFSSNHLFGHLPQCLGNLQQLEVLDLSSNDISGTIPSSLSGLFRLKSLHLSMNKFHGQIPLSLINCTSLITLDLGENKLSGSVPTWIGENLSSLTILKLRQNKMNGIIPLQLCHLTSLQVLDLAYNNVSGTIPRCFSKLSGMVNKSIGNWSSEYESYTDKITVTVNGRDCEYTRTLPLVTGLDLSNNNLAGMIHEDLMILSALRSLNLSKNNFEGVIPEKIGEMVSLESLDLSENQLSGRIPQSMSSLTFLSHLNLSYNKLSGEIPSGNQLQTLEDPSIYTGNPDLCGAPLKKCPEAKVVVDVKQERTEKDDVQMGWFYIGMACGHVVGFWGVCGVLLFKRPWRIAYFHFLNGVKDWLLVKIAVNMAQLKRRLERNQFDG